MAGRLRRRPFRPLGLRLQRFSRDYIRNYIAPTQPRMYGSDDLPPSWRSAANEPLNWGAPMGDIPAAFEPPTIIEQSAPATQPQFVPQAPRPPAVQSQRSGPPDLLRIMEIHENRRANLKAEAEQRRIQREAERGGELPKPPPLNQRHRASFDYVKPLVSSEEYAPVEEDQQADDWSDDDTSDELASDPTTVLESPAAVTASVQASRDDETN